MVNLKLSQSNIRNHQSSTSQLLGTVFFIHPTQVDSIPMLEKLIPRGKSMDHVQSLLLVSKLGTHALDHFTGVENENQFSKLN